MDTPTLTEALKRLVEAAEVALDQADFRNGVTDSTGTVDEGEVRIRGELADAVRNVRYIIEYDGKRRDTRCLPGEHQWIGARSLCARVCARCGARESQC